MSIKRQKGFAKGLLVLGLTFLMTSAQAAGVVVSGLSDGDGVAAYFTGGVTQSGPMDTVIGLDLSSFIAGTAGAGGPAGTSGVAFDTLAMTLTAPAGFFITSVSYSEAGNMETTNGFAASTGSIVADGTASNLAVVTAIPNTAFQPWAIGPAVIAVANKATIDASVVNSLFASPFTLADTARTQKLSATLTVGLTAIPLPPAIWLMGAAIAALVSVGRRQAA